MEECSGLKSHFYHSLRLGEHCKREEGEGEEGGREGEEGGGEM